MRKKNIAITLLLLLAALLCCMVVANMIGPVFIPPVAVIKTWINACCASINGVSQSYSTIILNIRLPRVLLAALVGMGLSCAGGALQGLFRNPMADPYVLGMSSGAAAGAALSLVCGFGAFFGTYAVQASAFIGAFGTIFLVYWLGRSEGKTITETVLLAGIAVGFFLQAIVSFLKVVASDEALRSVVLWMMGSFSTATWHDVIVTIVPIGAGCIGLACLGRELNALQSGEETAMHLGMRVEVIKNLVLIFVSLITASAVAVSGIIGFVGLIIPHVMRLIIGPDHRALIPASCLAGGIFMVIADTVARTAAGAAEIPIGIITAAIGGPYFIYLLRRRKKSVQRWV